MSSTTGKVTNKTGHTLKFTVGPVAHGDDPQILHKELHDGKTEDIFVAHSNGAGVEGKVLASGKGGDYTLHYDNPVVGSNSCSVHHPKGGKGSCDAGSGTNNIVHFVLE